MTNRLATAYAVFFFVVLPVVGVVLLGHIIGGPMGVVVAAGAIAATWYAAGIGEGGAA